MAINPNKIFYSVDNGASWEGPFSREEMDALTGAGIIPPDVQIRREGEDMSPPAPEPEAPQPGSAAAAPPPPPTPEEDTRPIRLAVGGQQHGPYTVSAVKGMQKRGEIHPQTMYWMEGMAEWRPLSELLGVAAAPPPPPGGDTLPKLQGFSISKFFSEVFKHHTRAEMLDIFCCGTARTTPHLMSIDTSWPAPWIFARLLFICVLLYLGFDWAFSEFENMKLTPGLIFVGTFGVPFCVFILFFELNICRDVSFYDAVKGLIIGGLLSIILSLFFYRHTQSAGESFGAMWAGPVEETGKLLIAVLIASGLRNGRILTGLLIGSAVGAGFAAFESAGYVFEHFMEFPEAVIRVQKAVLSGETSREEAARVLQNYAANWDPDNTLHVRALLAPFYHVLWTAITAGAYWMVLDYHIREGRRSAQDSSFGLSALTDFRFLSIAIIPALLHMFCNSPFFTHQTPEGIIEWTTESYITRIGSGIIGWIVALRLVQKGLHQIREEQERQQNQQQ